MEILIGRNARNSLSNVTIAIDAMRREPTVCHCMFSARVSLSAFCAKSDPDNSHANRIFGREQICFEDGIILVTRALRPGKQEKCHLTNVTLYVLSRDHRFNAESPSYQCKIYFDKIACPVDLRQICSECADEGRLNLLPKILTPNYCFGLVAFSGTCRVSSSGTAFLKLDPVN